MNVSLFSNAFDNHQKVSWRAAKNRPEDLTSAQSPRVSTNNSSDIVTTRSNKYLSSSTYVPPRSNKAIITNAAVSNARYSGTTEDIYSSKITESSSNTKVKGENIASPIAGEIIHPSTLRSNYALYTPYIYDTYSNIGSTQTTIDQFLSFLYPPNSSKSSEVSQNEPQNAGTRDHHGYTFGQTPYQMWNNVNAGNNDLYENSETSNTKNPLINRELSAHLAQQKDGSYCIGVISTGNNSNEDNEYANPTDAEKIIIAKLAENNISLDYKEGFVIKISTEGKFTLGDHNISDQSKVAEIENMIQNDESLQSDLSNIITSCLSQARERWQWNLNEDGNYIIGGSTTLGRLTLPDTSNEW
ncbi:MAG: hypothetical protein LBJ00_11835 [Planctomycetaceae bacterium]|jgi:hypothetical protein|nr:hypothetical protein [Planctomycetaceae bacterium]